MKLLIKRIILLMFLPFLPITLLVDIVFGDAVTGVKTSKMQKYKEHIKLFKEHWR